jgi:preprotein translocase subunit SecD
VVPLPAGEYGTTTRAGPRSLPAVGETIDQELAPIASAARVGLSRSHVDPATGHRGLAFVLSNQASETFRTYAAAHRDEHVAIVMDGVVLAVLAIDDNVAKGHFAFTGDYTEGEAKLLAGMLYRDPLPFDLEKTDDVEFVSQ